MKKVRCPNCAVINLDKFVTFPYCAGCGALLPQPSSAGAVPLWRRPLKPFLWVSAVGLAAAGLVAATTSFHSAPVEPGHIIIYGQAARVTQVGHLLSLRLTVDTIESPTSRDQRLHDVKLRLSGAWLRQFRFVELKPPPDAVSLGGSGRYYHYHTLARNTPLDLTVRALQPGRHRLKAGIYAEQEYPGEYHCLITVAAVTAPNRAPNRAEARRAVARDGKM